MRIPSRLDKQNDIYDRLSNGASFMLGHPEHRSNTIDHDVIIVASVLGAFTVFLFGISLALIMRSSRCRKMSITDREVKLQEPKRLHRSLWCGRATPVCEEEIAQWRRGSSPMTLRTSCGSGSRDDEVEPYSGVFSTPKRVRRPSTIKEGSESVSTEAPSNIVTPLSITHKQGHTARIVYTTPGHYEPTAASRRSHSIWRVHGEAPTPPVPTIPNALLRGAGRQMTTFSTLSLLEHQPKDPTPLSPATITTAMTSRDTSMTARAIAANARPGLSDESRPGAAPYLDWTPRRRPSRIKRQRFPSPSSVISASLSSPPSPSLSPLLPGMASLTTNGGGDHNGLKRSRSARTLEPPSTPSAFEASSISPVTPAISTASVLRSPQSPLFATGLTPPPNHRLSARAAPGVRRSSLPTPDIQPC